MVVSNELIQKEADEMPFAANEVLPGVHHIKDAMGVCMTLLVGDNAALLVDTGYGTEDVQAYVKTITSLPLTVLLTHGHHDHALGARWFEKTCMFAEDIPDFVTYTGAETRERVLGQAKAKGLTTDAGFMTDAIPLPEVLQEGDIDLGGMTARVIHCPGHTPGSAVVYVPERSLLLTADDWNPCTWLFFPAALGVKEYRSNVQKLSQLPHTHVLCSHQPVLFERSMMDDFLANLTDDTLRAAVPVDITPYEATDTRQAQLPHRQILVFDWAKALL